MSRGLVSFLLVFLVLSAAACRHVPVVSPGGACLPPRAEALQEDMVVLRSLTLRSLDWRARGARFRESVSERLGSGVLTSAELTRLYRGAEDYVFLDRRWEALVDCQGYEAWRRSAPALAHEPLARLQTKLVLAAALMQFDNYAVGVQPFFKEPKLRRLLRSDHPEVEGELDAAARRFLNPLRRQRLAGAVVWYRAEGGAVEAATPNEAYLDELIRQSSGYQFFSRALPERFVSEWVTGGHAGVAFVGDLLLEIGKGSMHATSATVGNAIGLVETRHGYLKDLPAAEKSALGAQLRPLDFNFDVESDRRIVCSELAFVVFPDVAWPTTRVLGRSSISPDQVAVKAGPGGVFTPVILYHDGVPIREKLVESLQCLLLEDGSALRVLHPDFVGRSERPAAP